MERFYEKANEQHVRGAVLYFKAADGILYYDSDTTEGQEVSKADLINLFNKGLVIVNDGSGFVRPTVLTVSTNYATVTHTTVGASDKAVATSFNSAGYVAG